MAFAFDTKGERSGLSTGDPVAFDYTCGTGAKLLVVFVTTSNRAVRNGGPPTYNEVALTQETYAADLSVLGPAECLSELWYMFNPPTGSLYEISCPNNSGRNIRLQAVSFTGTEDVEVFDTGSMSRTHTACTVTLDNTPAGAIVVSCLANGNTNDITANSHILLYSHDEGAWNTACQYSIQDVTEDETHTFTGAGTDDIAMNMIAFSGAATENYTRGDNAALQTNTDNDLETAFTSSDYTTVSIDDGSRVDQIAYDPEYSVFLFKDKYTEVASQIDVIWNGQSDYAPTSSTVFLQIYNRNSTSWETLDSENGENLNTDFDLEGSVTANLSNYFDANYWVSCRVYQQAT